MRTPDFNASEVASYYRARFPNLKQAGAEWRGSCPVHQGDDANFAVNPDNGLAYCHSQCGRGWSILQLEQTLSGRRWKECRDDVNVIVGRPVRGPAKLTEVATYDYTDAKGEFLFQVVRYEPKTFRQRRRVVKMDGTSAGISWEHNIKGISRVLYRLPKVAAADQVLIVEGEKDVGNLEKLGFVATCNPGGACTHAGKWLKNYTEALEGKRVVVLPDNDPPGQQHANVVVQAIRHRVAELRMLAIPEGKDASDWIAAGATRDVIQQAIDAAPIIAEQKAAGDGSGESPPTPGALAAAPETPGLPQIQVNDRPFRLICEEAVGALRSFNDPPNLFVRASRIACIEATELGRPFIADFDDHQDPPSPRSGRGLLRTQPARHTPGGAAADRCCKERSRPESGDLGISGTRGCRRGSHSSTGRIGPGAAGLRRPEPAVSRPLCGPGEHRGTRSAGP